MKQFADLGVIHIAEGAQGEYFAVRLLERVQQVMRRHGLIAADQRLHKIALRGLFIAYGWQRRLAQRGVIQALGDAAQPGADAALAIKPIPALDGLVKGFLRDFLTERLIAAQPGHIAQHHFAVLIVYFFGR